MAGFGPLRHMNAIRFQYPESRRVEVTRDYFVDNVVKRILGVGPADVLCLLSLEKMGVFELTMSTSLAWVEAAKKLGSMVLEQDRDPALREVGLDFHGSEFLIIVQTFNPYVPEEDLRLFLSRYCDGVVKGVKILDGYGLWTGKWRYFAQLRMVDGAFVSPPRRFALGANRGRLFVPELPLSSACWTCGKSGHESRSCELIVCHACNKVGHVAKDCKELKVCVLCGATSHLYRGCPKRTRTYAEAASGSERAGEAPKLADSEVRGLSGLGSKSGGVSGDPLAALAALVGPHGSQDGGLGTKGLEGDFLQVERQVADWAEDSAPREEEMETAVADAPGSKRPLLDESGDGGPGRRPRTGAEVPLPASPPERAEAKEVVKEASEASGLSTPVKDQTWSERRRKEVLAGPRGAPRMFCAQCGWGNHEGDKCPHMPRNKPAGLKPGEVWCEVCGETGHIDFHCPELRERYKDTFKQMEDPHFKGFGF